MGSKSGIFAYVQQRSVPSTNATLTTWRVYHVGGVTHHIVHKPDELTSWDYEN